MSRRKAGTLLPLEQEILAAGIAARAGGDPEFHGFAVAKAIAADAGSRRLTAHGTLYKALDRLHRAGLVESRWEDPDVAVDEGRPRRRLYRVTGEGELALARARLDAEADLPGRLAPA
jgi:DNA-binding PadR family transcriptional regulator